MDLHEPRFNWILEVKCAWEPHDAGQIGNSRIGSELVDQSFLESGELIARYIGANIITMQTSPAFDDHAWCCPTRLDGRRTAFCLLFAIRVDKESARTHYILGSRPIEKRLIYSDKDADATLGRIEFLHLRPHLVECSMENFSMLALAIAEKLKGKFVRPRIKAGEEISRHVLVVHRSG